MRPTGSSRSISLIAGAVFSGAAAKAQAANDSRNALHARIAVLFILILIDGVQHNSRWCSVQILQHAVVARDGAVGAPQSSHDIEARSGGKPEAQDVLNGFGCLPGSRLVCHEQRG